MSNSPYVNRRDAKLLSKKHQAVSMYFQENLKPKAIASKLRIPVNVVQASIDKFKREAK